MGNVKTKETELVYLDFDVLDGALMNSDYTKTSLSTLTGKSRCYLDAVRRQNSKVDANYEKLLCALIGVKPGTFIKNESESKSESKASGNTDISALEKKITELTGFLNKQSKKIDDLSLTIENLNNKLNATNSILYKLSESVDTSNKNHETEKVIARRLLEEVFADVNVVYLDEIMKKAAERGVSRDALMRAKKEMKLTGVVNGYGKNQKAAWQK